ncbi:MAG: hypothetical protein GY937_25535 [bacterium]|nr:hypothetical protein [bacterium]
MPQGVAILVDSGQTADAEITGATVVEVTERLGEPTLFSLQYAVTPAGGDLTWLSDGRLSPGTTLSMRAPSPEGEVCLVKGPVTGQRIHLLHGGAGSTLEVLGADTSMTMDRETKTVAHLEVTDSDVASLVLTEYGLVPDVTSTDARYSETGRPLVQRETDLRLLQRLARRNGFVFWVDCDATSGIETGHFKRLDLGSSAAQELAINLDPANLEALDLRWDAERPTSTTAKALDAGTLEAADGSAASTPLTLLGDQGLQQITGDTRTMLLSAPTADAADLRARAEGALIEADLFVQGTGSTTVSALGGVLRAHTLVELAGAGRRHSGRYLVTRVRHTIDSTGHVMRFELARNAWGAG